MQCADIFFIKADICQLGLDQRKVNMLAREYSKNNKVHKPPIILSHHMMLGLKEGYVKMSKSMPDSAIFMEDPADEVKRKIKKAFCPPGIVEDNPVLDYLKYLVFAVRTELLIERSEENGGNRLYKSYAELEQEFVEGKLHPMDLKEATAKVINDLLDPVRKHFATDPHAAELLEKVRSFQTTR